MKNLTAYLLISALFVLSSASGSSAKSNFDGPYGGLAVGYAKGLDKGREFYNNEITSYRQETKPSGYLLTTFAGFNKVLLDSFLLGVEADYDLRNNQGSSVQHHRGVPLHRYPVKTKVRNSKSFRLRAGKIFNDSQTLAYLTGGFATVKITRKISDLSNNITESPTKKHDGWTVGFGAEHFLSDNVSAKLVYRFSKYDSQEISGDQVYDSDRYETQKYRDHVIRLGVSYHF